MINSTCNPVTSKIAKSKHDLERIAKLRYQVYIEEQGKPYSEADHTNKSFGDVLDQEATLVMLEKQNTLVGTMRLNYLSTSFAYTQYYDFFELRKFPDIPLKTIGVCSRLAVSANHRNGVVREALFSAIYKEGYLGGYAVCFAACTPILFRLFKAYGFREYTTSYIDPVVGTLKRLLLIVDDIEHLKVVNSPFYTIAMELNVQPRFNKKLFEQIFLDFRMENEAHNT